MLAQGLLTLALGELVLLTLARGLLMLTQGVCRLSNPSC
jgi:hypothetical protein